MTEAFWNQRYGNKEYAYGLKPNNYFREFIEKLTPGRLLLPGDGEGRNAVYAALKGWVADAIDQSEEGKKKALRLAGENKVTVNYRVEDLSKSDFGINRYDLVALIFVHFPSGIRTTLHNRLVKSLKNGGYFLIEAFSKGQLGRSSGGPQNEDSLNNREEFENDFKSLEILELYEDDIILDEGPYHQGKASVLRMIARK